ncbi:MAG TPA: protein adenylyltransferase SelO family protein [Cytophagaceae bacterium]
MSIIGLTIDYGPYSFLDDYNPGFTPNTTDLPGRRYAFGRQAAIAFWNLGRLADAISSLVPDREELAAALEGYKEVYWKQYYYMMGNKLGLDQVYTEDIDFIDDFEQVLSSVKPDMTLFYQLLIDLSLELKDEKEIVNHFKDSYYRALLPEESKALYHVLQAYIERIKSNSCSREESILKMKKANPRFILRNYLLYEAIDALTSGDNTLFLKLQEAIKEPYSDKFDEFFKRRPDWATRRPGCSMLSCSS